MKSFEGLIIYGCDYDDVDTRTSSFAILDTASETLWCIYWELNVVVGVVDHK